MKKASAVLQFCVVALLLVTVEAKEDLSPSGGTEEELFVPLSSDGSYDMELQQKLKRFNQWFWEMSEVNKKVSIRASQWGNGVFLKAPIADSSTPRKQVIKLGETIMELKEEFTLCDASLKYRTLLVSSSSASYGERLLNSGVSEQDRVALALLTEYLLGSHSKIQPWMDILPKISDLTPPHMWDSDLQDMIEPITLRDETRQRAQSLDNEYRSLATHSSGILRFLEEFVLRYAPEGHLEKVEASQAEELARMKSSAASTRSSSSGSSGKLLRLFTKDRVLWARSLIDTRAWNMNGKKWLNPAADMFNHQPDHEDEIYDYKQTLSLGQRSHKFLKFHKVEPRNSASKEIFARAFSDRSVYNRPRKNDSEIDEATHMQVYESYGDNTNDIYFLYHGFVPREHNKNDCQKLEMKLHDRHLGGFKPISQLQSQVLRTVPTLQPAQCIHLGEVPPGLLVVGLVSQLSKSRLESKCILDALRLPQGGKSLHFAMKSRYAATKKCLELEEGETGMGVIANGLKYSKAVVKGQFQALFSTSDIERDSAAIMELEAGTRTSVSKIRDDQQMTALKMRVSRKKILKGLLSDLGKYISKYQNKRKMAKGSDQSRDEL